MNFDIVDVLTDPRLSNIPAPDPSPPPSARAKRQLSETPHKYWGWEILGAVAAWGHLTPKLLSVLCPAVKPEKIEETLALLWEAGCLRRHRDCPVCENIVIWSLRAGPSLTKAVASQPPKHQQGFFGEPLSENLDTTNYCPPPLLCKHDFAASELAFRLSQSLEEGWIVGARDSRCSALLRMPKPERNDTAWRAKRKSDSIERWADLTYIRKRDGLRVAIEVTVSQNRSQLASKARWWGVCISERGGPDSAGLRVVILDPPGKKNAPKAVADAFPASSGFGGGHREAALDGVLTAKWEEWVNGQLTPAAENGWKAYKHPSAGRSEDVRLTDLEGSDPRWAHGISEAVRRRQLKGVFACSPVAAKSEPDAI